MRYYINWLCVRCIEEEREAQRLLMPGTQGNVMAVTLAGGLRNEEYRSYWGADIERKEKK